VHRLLRADLSRQLLAQPLRHPGGVQPIGHAVEVDLLDRKVGGGNSVIPDQDVLFEALGRIPADETFAVAVGEPQQGWTDLTATYAETFLRYFLLPRRVDPEARWIICFACDRQAIPGARAVWEGEDGIAILRRQP